MSTRKTAHVTISEPGRDLGKVFVLTEMSARQAERWAMRALLAAAKGGADFPEDVTSLGMQGMAIVGLRALSYLPFDEADALMEEMFGCIQIQPDPKQPNVVRPLIDDDIEEVRTRIFLRAEVFKLHVDFSKPGVPLNAG